MALKPGSEIWNYFTNIPEEGMAECKFCKQRLRNNRSYNLKYHLSNVHKNRSELDNFFEVNVLDNLAICRTCGQRLKYRLCNLRLHMRRFHNIEIKLSEYKPSENLPSQQSFEEDQIKAVLKATKRKMVEQSGNVDKRPTHRLFIKMDKETIIRSVIGLIIEDGVSPNFFSSKHMGAVLSPMCVAVSQKQGREFKMDVAEIEGILSLMVKYIRNDFSNDLHCRLLSIKIDTDLNALANTFCISAQFNKEGEIKNRVLGLIDLKDDYLLKEDHIKQILYKFNIDSNQIISAFWDNTKPQQSKHVKNSEYLKEIEQFASYPDIFLGDVRVEPYVGCIAQLCLLDIFKNSNIFQPFLECRNLVKYISDESNGYHELFALNNFSIPQLDSPWKAGTTCKMMNDLHEARNLFQTVKFEELENPEDYFNCNEDLWSFIEAFCKSTNYLHKCILKYYSEELNIGDFYAQWLKCKILTEKMLSANNKPSDVLSTMLKEMLNIIENKIEELLSKDSLVACLYLDPRFQHILNSNQKSNAIEYLKKTWCRAKLYTDDDLKPNEEIAAQLFDDNEDAFLSHDLQVNNKESSDVFQKIELLKLPFKGVDTNVLEFWKARKKNDFEMHALSSICFAIPATAIYDKMRYSNVYQMDVNSELSAFTKENLLIMRLNAHLLDDAVAYLQLTDDEQSNASSILPDAEVETYEISEDENSNTTSTVTTYSDVVSNPSSFKTLPSSSTDPSTELPSKGFV